jgi:hypothetical protein
MKYRIYKPNPKNTGCAATVDIAQIGDHSASNLFISMIQQKGWDNAKRTGSFSGGKDINFKLSVAEAGEMVSSIKSRIPFVAFHKFNDDSTIIRFVPWDQNRTVKEKNGDVNYKTPAWSLNVKRNGSDAFRLPISSGESQVLNVILKKFIADSLIHTSEQDVRERAKKAYAPANRTNTNAPEEDNNDPPF